MKEKKIVCFSKLLHEVRPDPSSFMYGIMFFKLTYVIKSSFYTRSNISLLALFIENDKVCNNYMKTVLLGGWSEKLHVWKINSFSQGNLWIHIVMIQILEGFFVLSSLPLEETVPPGWSREQKLQQKYSMLKETVCHNKVYKISDV